ncbi:MAG: tripartite tricarboxylate transporter substrate binding protein [Rhizobiales bacterium]|nr:tripartite tricarboxylate transporter substrate binding protein [Hyphomicrobiales bacterium]
MSLGVITRRVAFACAGLLLAAAGSAQAQGDYPTKAVRIIVDSGPGSATDVALRITAERLSKIWNQQVIALNHPGAGGSIAARVAAQSPNDGYTLYFAAASTFTALAGAPGVPANLPIQVPRDFLPIGFVTQQPMFLAASPKSGINSIADLIARAKKRPGEISYAATGIGRITHLTMELLQMRAGIKLQMVPYAGGPNQALSDLISGRVAIVLDGYGGLAPGLAGGSLKAIAVGSKQRLPEFPNLPTVAETLPGFFAGGWNVLVTPVGTPDTIVRKVSADLRVVLDDKEVKAKFAGLGAYVDPMSPEELTAFIQEQQGVWKPVAEAVASAQKK